MNRVEETLAVSGQVDPLDMPKLAAAGIRMIINNRPDGEMPGQPTGAVIAAAAERAGLAYHAVPVGPNGIGPDQIEAMAAALDANMSSLAFCRSGTRSVHLWALTRASQKRAPAPLIASAAAAGYDLMPLAPVLERLANGGAHS